MAEKKINKVKKEKKEKIENVEVIKNKETKPKKEKKAKNKKASFIERLGAFIIDFFMVSFIASLITYPLTNSSNYNKLSKEATTVMEQYTKGKIDEKTYLNKSADISYDMSRQTGLTSIITIIIFALYFIVFQFKNNGQTMGKKLLKIKISKSDNSDLSINDIMFRSLIIDFILFDIVVLCFTMFSSKNVYFYATGIFQFIQYGIIFGSAIMILSRKDKCGIHDLITHTKVVKENELAEELEVCES